MFNYWDAYVQSIEKIHKAKNILRKRRRISPVYIEKIFCGRIILSTRRAGRIFEKRYEGG